MSMDAQIGEAASRRQRKLSRRTFLGGMAVGAAGAWGLSSGLARLGYDPARPPELYEYFLDNFWFKAADLEHQAINPPLKGNHKADIVIIGGGFTGLSSAYHLSRAFPNKKIVLLEGACCEHAWGGTMGFTMDFTPSVGVIGDDKNIFYGVAYNGEGVAFSQTAGRVISELMTGEESELTKLFVVNHQMPYLGPSNLRIVFERLYNWYLVRTAAKTVR